MTATIPLRPGVVLGPNPERKDPEDGVLDRLAARLAGFGRRRSVMGGLRGMLPQVRAHGRRYRRYGTEELQAELLRLRRELGRRGLTDPLCARTFALVREISGRELGMRHFGSQLTGGWIILNGMLAEMETGEGKTLTATLPAATSALAGTPVHVVTSNDYLAGRDAELMGPVYRALGLSVGVVTEGMDTGQRQAAYACDVTYCTNKQLAFDYLRDRLVLGPSPGRLRLGLEGLYSRTPRSSRLLLRGLFFAIVDEADSVLIDEARTPLIISGQGQNPDEQRVYDEALRMARALEAGTHYETLPRGGGLGITDAGRERLSVECSALGGIWSAARRREELVQQALAALHQYQRERDYLVRDGKVQIIDEYTGRVMPDRSWERGLHQMIEAKEGCELSSQRETLARISYQRFFRRYLRLGGMTGTAREVAGELSSVYGLRVVRVPTHRPVRREVRKDRVYGSLEEKWSKVVERVGREHGLGRPILIGCRSVADSEHLSGLLAAAGLAHQVLNARQDGEEAAIIRGAGGGGCITVATNMAGRGTDIRLAKGVAEKGGLHVISVERNEARRIDRQLFGRCGRQGDPGSVESIVSLDDELPAGFYPNALRRALGRSTPLPVWLGLVLVALPQWLTERRHAHQRRKLMYADDYLSNLLAFSGRPE